MRKVTVIFMLCTEAIMCLQHIVTLCGREERMGHKEVQKYVTP